MSEQPQETKDQARTRRRWITLAEAVAVAGALIAGLTLYLNWTERSEDRAARSQSAQVEQRAATIITLRATKSKDGDRLDLTDAQHPIEAIDVTFPNGLGADAVASGQSPALQADWIDDAVKRAFGDAKAGRIPVLIASTSWAGERKIVDRAIYDLRWRRDGGLFGSSIKLEGLALRERGGNQARLDAIWRREAPAGR